MAYQGELFCAIPARAIGDKRLSATDFRTLGAIAVHDRINRNGSGCYATNPRLASLVGCHLKALSRSLTALAEYGYIAGKKNPLNQRTRIYNVIYTDFDLAYFKAGGVAIGNDNATHQGDGSNLATDDEAENVAEPILSEKRPLPGSSTEIGNDAATQPAQIGNKVSEKAERFQEDASGNIFCETVIYPDESLKQRSETASMPNGALEGAPSKSVGAILGSIERKIKRGGMTFDETQMWQGWIDSKIHSGQIEARSNLHHWACRLSDELETLSDSAWQKQEASSGTA